MTLFEQITALGAAIARIEHNPDSVIGGSRAYYSGHQTYLKPAAQRKICLLYTSPSPRDYAASRMPSSA